MVKPDAEWIEQTSQNKENGEYEYDLIADQEGSWNVTIAFGNSNHSLLFRFLGTVILSAGMRTCRIQVPKAT